jgi:hypothetical protein
MIIVNEDIGKNNAFRIEWNFNTFLNDFAMFFLYG